MKTSAKRRTRAAKPIDEATTHHCILCKKHFADSLGFKAHHIFKFTQSERCLDADELRALDFKRRKNGVWATDITTQLLPSQIARLASVRQDSERLVKAGGPDPQGVAFSTQKHPLETMSYGSGFCNPSTLKTASFNHAT